MTTDERKVFGARMRERRVVLGMTQGELAEKIGMSGPSIIGKAERGICQATRRVVKSRVNPVSVGKALKCSPDFLLGRTDDPAPKEDQQDPASIHVPETVSAEDALNLAGRLAEELMSADKESRTALYRELSKMLPALAYVPREVATDYETSAFLDLCQMFHYLTSPVTCTAILGLLEGLKDRKDRKDRKGA